tara:strand:- start:27 stop:221 length:195 start_codon:yes stop_codon:yes gene_type:complete
MPDCDLIEQRQYAESVLAGLNIKPLRVDVGKGVLLVPKGRMGVVRKLCKHFDWPFTVSSLTQGS